MTTPHNLSLKRIKAVAQALRPLSQEVVFVGGATVALYCDPQQTVEIRPTDDVDVVVELATYGSYSELDAKLRAIGFCNDVMSGVICRYQIQGITVDVMPTVPDALGFSNRWYPDGFRQAISVPVDENSVVKIFSAPYFIASKWEACKSRGGDDLRWSTDFEDIVFVLDNASEIEAELRLADQTLKDYFQGEFSRLLTRTDTEEAIYGHLEPRFAAQRTKRILQILNNLVQHYANL